MNVYVVLPLIALIANITLGTYILNTNPKSKINRLYALFSYSIASWSLICILFFISSSTSVAIFWDKLMAANALFACSFLLHFFVVYTRQQITPAKTCLLIYTPVVVFAAIALLTDSVVKSVEPASWGNAVVPGYLYNALVLAVAAYTVLGLILCAKFFFQTTLKSEKQQALLLIIAVGFLTLMGLFTELVPILFNRQAISLTSTFSTVTTVIVAVAIAKYNLMSVTPAMAINKIIETMTDYLLVVDKDNKIVLVDNALQEVLGKTKAELINRDLDDLPIRLKGLSKEFVGSDSVKNFESDLTDKHRDLVPVSIDASNMLDSRGNLAGRVLVMRDIRDVKGSIKNLEEDKRKIESSNKELEQMNKLMIGRELKMIELKKRIKELEENQHLSK